MNDKGKPRVVDSGRSVAGNNGRRLFRKGLVAAALAVGLAGPAWSTVILSDFSTGTDGWQTGDMGVTGVAPTGLTGTVNYDAAGQHIQTADILAWTGFLAAPKFTGDLSAFFGGTVSYDLRDVDNDGVTVSYVNILLVGAGSERIYIRTPPPSTSAFTHFAFSLDTGSGWLDKVGVIATEAQIRSVLGSVSAVYVSADWKTGPDDSRLDNFCVRTVDERACGQGVGTVPEPSHLALAGLGLLLLGATRQRSSR